MANFAVIMEVQSLLNKVLDSGHLNLDEGVFLYKNASLSELMYVSDIIRYRHNPVKEVTWIIDRNVNLGNGCISACRFCNFYRPPGHPEAYITTEEQYVGKIKEMIKLGGNQLLLQGGLNPGLDINYYIYLFKFIKSHFPEVKLHALGPPEIVFLAKQSGTSIENVLKELVNAGLDSLPGAGAEILSDRVRKLISPVKCSSEEWLEVMRIAHLLDLTTSATMMFGHLETIEERVWHLVKIRELQSVKPEGSKGFISFTSWPFQSKGTRLEKQSGPFPKISETEYIRMVSFSRIMLDNIANIQVSWLTMGVDTAQLCLHAGANDMGSVMIEENVVSAAGSDHKITPEAMRIAIYEAGFVPVLRDQQYNKISG